MKQRYFYLPLAAGILTPSFVIFIIEVFITKLSPFKSVLDILHRQFAEGKNFPITDNLFKLMALSSIPFVALILLTWIVSLKTKGKRLDCIFWGGFIAVLGLTLFGQVMFWYPFYSGKVMDPFASLSLIFTPFYCLLFLVLGSGIGRVVSDLPKFKNG